METDQALHLSPIQVRILACLVEKEATTPDQYPLSLNALRNACNQKSNRDPVVNYEEGEVGHALRELEQMTLVSESWSVRVPKYQHHMGRALDLTGKTIAALCPLMLRGPQTLGEIRNHSRRLHEFEDLEDVENILTRLSQRQPALVMELPRQPGQKENRYVHLLSGEPDPAVMKPAPAQQRVADDSLLRRVEALEAAVALLTEKLAVLEQDNPENQPGPE